jgi:hypothetical protein
LTAAGGDDVQARYLHVSIVDIVTFYRAFCVLGPVLGFGIAYFVAKDLQRRAGVEKAPRLRLRRNAKGGFEEEPLP